MANVPTNKKLYARVKSEAKKNLRFIHQLMLMHGLLELTKKGVGVIELHE